jgi:hypothetical protein
MECHTHRADSGSGVKPFPTDFFKPGLKRIFVFGSNRHGHHGAGAAKWALEHAGACYGQPCGGQGQSYAITTKDYDLTPLRLDFVRWGVQGLLAEALKRPDLTFYVTPIGCGYARRTPDQIRPFFKGYSSNIILPPEFK